MPRRTALGVAVVYAVLGGLWVLVSDRLLPDLGATPDQVAWLGTVKGLVFVFLTATLIYTALRITPRAPESGDPVRSRGGLLAATFAMLAAVVLVVGYQAHQYNVRNLEGRYHGALRAVAETKAQRVGEWLEMQLQSLAAHAHMHVIDDHSTAALAGDPVARDALLTDFDQVARILGNDAILLAGAGGEVLLAAGLVAQPNLVATAVRAASADRPGIAFGAGGSGAGAAQVALAQPVPGSEAGAGTVYLVSLLDIKSHLGPLVERWILSDSEGESALASLGPGGELVVLPGFRSPLSGDEIVRFPQASRAGAESLVAGRTRSGVYQGYNADGRPVALAFSRVPGVDWVVASAMDRSEIFAGMVDLSRNTTLVVLVAVLIAGWLILALFRQQQSINRRMIDSVLRERDVLDRHFSYLTRFANDAVMLLDADGRILNCNDRALTMYGYGQDELLAMNVRDLPPPGLATAAVRQFERVKAEGGMVFETWQRRRDGSEFPVEVSTRSFEVDGETFVQSIVRDITERKHSEEALRRSEARFRSIFDHTLVGIAHLAPDGRILHANRGLAEMLGYGLTELEGMALERITDPQYLEDELGLLRGLYSGGSDSYSIEKRYVCKNGSRVWGQVAVTAIRDEFGKLDYFVAVVQNVSARKQLEAQLQRRSQLSQTLSATNRAIARARSREALLNEACAIAVSVTSLKMAAVVGINRDSGGCTVLAAAGDDSRVLAEEMYRRAAQGGVLPFEQGRLGELGLHVVNDLEAGPVGADMRLACLRRGVRAYACFPLGNEGSMRFAMFSSDARFFEGDTLELLSDMARDLSIALVHFAEREARERAERRHREEMRRARDELEARVRERTEQLAAARDRAEEADRIKTAFLANMSHELRTPLNSIIGFSSLLLSGAPGPLNVEQGKQLGIIRGSGERLLALIEDILDVSRLQSVDAQLACEPTPLRDMMLRAADALRPQAAGRGLVLETRIEPCVAMAEPRRLEQVVANLLSNAVRYTDEGSVTLACRRRGWQVEISVTDTGVGISPEDMGRLFVPFVQFSRSDSGRDGAGLGLAISRRLVEAMGGQITAESTPGQGSCFTVSLRAAGA